MGSGRMHSLKKSYLFNIWNPNTSPGEILYIHIYFWKLLGGWEGGGNSCFEWKGGRPSMSMVYLSVYEIICLCLYGHVISIRLIAKPYMHLPSSNSQLPYFPCLAFLAPATATCFASVFPPTMSLRVDNMSDHSSNSINGIFSRMQYWIRSIPLSAC